MIDGEYLELMELVNDENKNIDRFNRAIKIEQITLRLLKDIVYPFNMKENYKMLGITFDSGVNLEYNNKVLFDIKINRLDSVDIKNIKNIVSNLVHYERILYCVITSGISDDFEWKFENVNALFDKLNINIFTFKDLINLHSKIINDINKDFYNNRTIKRRFLKQLFSDEVYYDDYDFNDLTNKFYAEQIGQNLSYASRSIISVRDTDIETIKNIINRNVIELDKIHQVINNIFNTYPTPYHLELNEILDKLKEYKHQINNVIENIENK